MRILGIILAILMFSTVAFAEQQTTVYSKVLTTKTLQGEVPEIDGLSNINLQKNVNNILAAQADKLLAEIGGHGEVSYTVELNKPTLVGILLQATNNSKTVYKAVNLDMTTGKEVVLGDFVRQGMAVREVVGSYEDLLFAEKGLYTRNAVGKAYTKFIPYARLLPVLRVGDAGRLLPMIKVSQAVDGRIVKVPVGTLVAVNLESNRTTGYSWQVNVSDSGSVLEVGRSYIMPPENIGRAGAPGMEIIYIAAQEAGTYPLAFEYKRGWEKLGVQWVNFTLIAE